MELWSLSHLFIYMCECVCTSVCVYVGSCVWSMCGGGCEMPLVYRSLLPSLETLQLGWSFSRPSSLPVWVPPWTGSCGMPGFLCGH